MTDQTPHLTPALTAGEWRMMSGPQLAVLTAHATPHELHQQVAINNHALPEGDPRRITWADVVLLQQLRDETGVVAAHELAAKLAALLPPR